MTHEEALYKYVLRLGDNALIHGNRLSEWCSKDPILRHNSDLPNIALDTIGLAKAFLKYAAKIEGNQQTENDLAYNRSEQQFYNHQITELPNPDFMIMITKQLFISTFELHLFNALSQSADETIATIAKRGLEDVHYHFIYSRYWCYSLSEGLKSDHVKLQQTINDLWSYTGEFFEMSDEDNLLLANGIAADLTVIHQLWKETISAVLTEVKLQIPEDRFMQTGSRKGVHTEHLVHILTEMQYLQRSYRYAKW
ncbi:MAG: phenylacetate-CoA oxygenase subunit PaaI [Candidatus Fluviicola riflensis]|nr:MAG: phenylacetate-CoA oxygenase subunit PaaI [Candidatus Fluviicola riflensis]OGS78815.1 MAG: phenylacetate-CoA oxygenase subunit PaaI [Candidatus Fluviicola riflensis]OGS85837.1 MAG: phenylacetate-CoA oxygenase subunit PaaI [Fluviicola sp. RIFCSPHIGHO2_12_FULL_43_24]OGS86246.1 MAG: phenylacetate-CoA oxygenase subunit PaaI [Fluviicola sp. RIFCSPHIGHO2_01_FULL_43_53]